MTSDLVGRAAEVTITTRNLGKAFRLVARPGRWMKHAVRGRQGIPREEFWALRDVDLDVHRGETLGVLGVNGAGKSTLLQLICGTLQPTTGIVKTSGRIAALLGLGAGFHPQFTGRENVRLKAAALGLSRRQIEERMDSIAEFAGIGEFLDLPVRVYSSGMYARLAFAVCAHVDADILIVDEILAVGDAGFRQKCTRFINRFRAQGTVLLVSHNSGTVAELCDRALWLERGRVREIGPASDVSARYLASLSDVDALRPQIRSEVSTDQLWAPPPPPLLSDFRARMPDRITVTAFDCAAPFHGEGGAAIDDVAFHNVEGERLAEMHAGDEVELRISGHATREISQPMVGFIVRDRFGQNVFGDNTFVYCGKSSPRMGSTQRFEATFLFQMPNLARGSYSVTAAVVDGTQEDHAHLHWVEDTLTIRVLDTRVARGVAAMPASDIRFELQS